MYNLQTQGQTALGETAVGQLGRVRDSFSQPLDLSGVPDRVSSVAAPAYERFNQQDNSARTKEVEDSLYRSATNRLDSQYAQRENSERTRLINAGVPEGSEAFNNAMNTFSQQRQADYGDARDRAIQGSGAEDSRLVAQQLAALGFNNSTETQGLYDAIAGGNFQNTARGTAIDEASYLRNEPLNAYNALSTGSQVTNPQFRGTGQVQGPAAAPVFAGAQAAGQDALSLYNSQMDAANAARGGLTSFLGTAAGGLMGGGLFGKPK